MPLKKYRHQIEFIVLLGAITLFWFLGKLFQLDTQGLSDSLKKLPFFLSEIIYVVLYVVVTFFVFFSKDVFWLTGALLFGPLISTVLICIAESINAVILFNLSRRLGRSYVEKTVAQKYRYLDDKLGKINFFWLFIFRAAPLIPYRFLDLAAGLTSINLRKYMAAVIFGSPVKMFWIQYILFGVGKSILQDPNLMVDYFLRNKNLLYFSFLYIILIAMTVFKLGKRK